MLNNKTNHSIKRDQAGVSLIELLVGLVIGLFTILAIMQVFSVFEGQKRTTSGSADAQTNGAIAMMNIQRNVQMAGYGLPMPMASIENSSLKCDRFANFSFDPVEIMDGGGAANDQITVRYSTSAKGAVPVEVIGIDPADSNRLIVRNVIGCGAEMTAGDYGELYANPQRNVVLIQRGSLCGMTSISTQPTATDPSDITTLDTLVVNGSPSTFSRIDERIEVEDTIACMGNWASYTFDVNNNMELQRNQQAIVSGVVALQAQYGISATAASNNVITWVDATGAWAPANITVSNRNRIKAIRFAIVLRNGLKEKDDVTQAQDITNALDRVISGSAISSSIPIDISARADLPDWRKYRYRVFGTTIPVRNMLWSRDAL